MNAYTSNGIHSDLKIPASLFKMEHSKKKDLLLREQILFFFLNIAPYEKGFKDFSTKVVSL